MSVAETWQGPDHFTSSAQPEAGLRVVIVDGTAADEQLLLQAARAAGIDCPWGHWSDGNGGRAALLFEGRDHELVQRCLRALRATPHFDQLPAILAVTLDRLAHVEAASGFDDFVLHPCTPLEIRTRIRAIEQRRQALALHTEPDADGIQSDAVSHEALLNGRTIQLTAREFALFAYLRARRGCVLSRQHLLAHVWGHRYHGGQRTVDTHIGRLRLKFGAALPIETVRSNGYRLNRPCATAAAAE